MRTLTPAMDYLDAIILGIVEGLTEFLPVSSTGHLTIVEKMLGLKVDDSGVTAYTAVIQMGAIAAVLLYFRRDIWRIAVAWFRGLFRPEYRGHFDHRFGWYIIVGSIPIGVVGFLGKDVVTGPLRSLWWVGASLVFWCAVMVYAERVGRQDRGRARPDHDRHRSSSGCCSASPWSPASRAPAPPSRAGCCATSTAWPRPG